MPILNVPNEVEIELTHKCNWDCRYCAIRTHSLPVISEEEALDKVKAVAGKFQTITFSGGEPGLLSKEILEQMIKVVEDSGSVLCINTNGTFIRKYPDMVSSFDEVIYHCSRDLDDTLLIYPQFNNIRYMLVVDDVNYPRLKYYLDSNLDVVFDIVPASYEPGDTRKQLSVFNRMEIIKKFSDRITFESQRRLFVDKNFDSVKYF